MERGHQAFHDDTHTLQHELTPIMYEPIDREFAEKYANDFIWKRPLYKTPHTKSRRQVVDVWQCGVVHGINIAGRADDKAWFVVTRRGHVPLQLFDVAIRACQMRAAQTTVNTLFDIETRGMKYSPFTSLADAQKYADTLHTRQRRAHRKYAVCHPAFVSIVERTLIHHTNRRRRCTLQIASTGNTQPAYDDASVDERTRIVQPKFDGHHVFLWYDPIMQCTQFRFVHNDNDDDSKASTCTYELDVVNENTQRGIDRHFQYCNQGNETTHVFEGTLSYAVCAPNQRQHLSLYDLFRMTRDVDDNSSTSTAATMHTSPISPWQSMEQRLHDLRVIVQRGGQIDQKYSWVSVAPYQIASTNDEVRLHVRIFRRLPDVQTIDVVDNENADTVDCSSRV